MAEVNENVKSKMKNIKCKRILRNEDPFTFYI